jgi:hypothetical protein
VLHQHSLSHLQASVIFFSDSRSFSHPPFNE